VEKAPDAGLTEHLGHERHEAVANARGNTRNGKSKKTLKGSQEDYERYQRSCVASAHTAVPCFDNVGDSVIGKIHLSLTAFVKLPAGGTFISNAGCDMSLASGANAATSLPCSVRLGN
jgi:hypothetical protein